MLLRNARLRSGGDVHDVRIVDGRVRLGPSGADHPGSNRGGSGSAGVVGARVVGAEVVGADEVDVEVVDLEGRLVLPGLWDAHVHFDQWAATRQRLDLSGARSASQLVDVVAQRLQAEPGAPGGILLGYGFRDGLWPDTPTAAMLDVVAPTVPVVLVSGDLHSAWLNSPALQRFSRAGHPTGLLRETEWIPIMSEVARVPEAVADQWAAEAGAAAAARGVVGIIDFELPDVSASWARRIAGGMTNLRVQCSVWPERLDDAIARGLRTGDPIPGTAGLATMGPLKVITDGSLNTRTAYCHDPYPGMTGPEAHGVLAVPSHELVPLMRRAWRAGLETSIHAIGDHANSLVLDAFAEVGSRGTVEHAQLLDEADFRRFADLDVIASIQPEHALDDRDVADRYWAGRTGRAFAYGGLLAAGAQLALGSDAPVAPLDPWVAIAAAVCRTRDDRPSWHPEHELPIDVALAASARGRASVADGDVADLVVVDADPFTAAATVLRAMPVSGTMLEGRWTYRTIW